MQIDQYNNIPEVFFKLAESNPQLVVYHQALPGPGASKNRAWKARNYQEVRERISKIAAELRQLGVKKGDKVGILSNTRPEWMEADIAILSLGGVVVSIYQSLPAQEVAYILYDSQAKIIFAENQEQVDKLVSLDGQSSYIPATEEHGAFNTTLNLTKFICFESCKPNPMVKSLEDILNSTSAEIPTEYKQTGRGELAALVYTSGTTGPPKGVMQTHLNHLSNIRQALASGWIKESYSLFLCLPLAHSFAKLMGYLGFLTKMEIRFPSVADTRTSKLDPKSITQEIREANTNIVPLVPRFFEKMKEGLSLHASSNKPSGLLLNLTIKTALEVSTLCQENKSPTVLTRVAYAVTTPLRRKIKAQLFGKQFMFAVSGGAKLPLSVAKFFNALEIEILEGYGLTETCVATNVNHSGKNKLGTVGPVLAKDIEMKISEDGEILFRGPNVTQGYYNRPQATKSSWDEAGWFHTGDLGSIDSEGYLTITGRKKEIIITAGGKKIPPHLIEDKLKGLPFVVNALLIGEGRPYCIALLVINQEGQKKKDIRELLWKELQQINSNLASFETVKNFLIADSDFSVENGLMTPTFKIKRSAVEVKYREQIEQLYADTTKPLVAEFPQI